jgi:hypothetical protein
MAQVQRLLQEAIARFLIAHAFKNETRDPAWITLEKRRQS